MVRKSKLFLTNTIKITRPCVGMLQSLAYDLSCIFRDYKLEEHPSIQQIYEITGYEYCIKDICDEIYDLVGKWSSGDGPSITTDEIIVKIDEHLETVDNLLCLMKGQLSKTLKQRETEIIILQIESIINRSVELRTIFREIINMVYGSVFSGNTVKLISYDKGVDTFVRTRCNIGVDFRIGSTVLFNAYVRFMEDKNNCFLATHKQFVSHLKKTYGVVTGYGKVRHLKGIDLTKQ